MGCHRSTSLHLCWRRQWKIRQQPERLMEGNRVAYSSPTSTSSPFPSPFWSSISSSSSPTSASSSPCTSIFLPFVVPTATTLSPSPGCLTRSPCVLPPLSQIFPPPFRTPIPPPTL